MAYMPVGLSHQVSLGDYGEQQELIRFYAVALDLRLGFRAWIQDLDSELEFNGLKPEIFYKPCHSGLY